MKFKQFFFSPSALSVTVAWTSGRTNRIYTAYGGSKKLSSFEGHDIMGINLYENGASAHLYKIAMMLAFFLSFFL